MFGRNNTINTNFSSSSTIRDMKNSNVTINGINITGSANSVVIKNNKVYVDGKDVTPSEKEINIEVHGNVNSINADSVSRIVITGNTEYAKTMSGSIDVHGNVLGDASTMSGDIRCGNINGSVKTISGNISKRL